MGQITGGRILFGDAVKHNPADQYSLSRKAEAEFSFAGAEGEAIEGVCEQAIALARAKVAEMLSGKATVVTAAASSDQTKAALAEKLGTEPKTTVVKKPKVPPAQSVEPAKPADDMAELEPAKTVTPEQVKAVVAEGLKTTEVKVADNDMDDGLFDSGPAQISDADLLDKIKAKNGELINGGHKASPAAIKALVASMFKPEELPKQAREIPMALRPDFLAKLAALTVPT